MLHSFYTLICTHFVLLICCIFFIYALCAPILRSILHSNIALIIDSILFIFVLCAPILHSTLHSNMHSLSHLFRIHLFVLCYALHLCTQFCTLLKHSVFNFHSKCVQQKTAKIVSFLHTVRNLHFLSKNSTLISRDNCRFFWVKN